MRHYSIYLMSEEVTERYYGQEAKLFQLFLDEHHAEGSKKDIIARQVKFVTRSIRFEEIKQLFIQKKQTISPLVFQRGEEIVVHVQKKNSEATLSGCHSHLVVRGEGNVIAETIVFDFLSKYDRCFFAVDLFNVRYGWLFPLRKIKFG